MNALRYLKRKKKKTILGTIKNTQELLLRMCSKVMRANSIPISYLTPVSLYSMTHQRQNGGDTVLRIDLNCYILWPLQATLPLALQYPYPGIATTGTHIRPNLLVFVSRFFSDYPVLLLLSFKRVIVSSKWLTALITSYIWVIKKINVRQ